MSQMKLDFGNYGSSSAHRISSAPFGSGDNGNCSICHLPEELEFQVLKAFPTDG
ncbi:GD10937 [Drosophila simulans]|uniref:GD10937 n=1 Tax=Drosophila simulans TaxID=7240 RepID=B4QDX3_DROSI|nr:GD10937 [Drosophila simulans]